ncbi:polysaccharide pyruvyl transferase family protein [Duganella sp. sic0402]|uniref:polysaccharide pyruvyl transferase family protein n=1 Tax=Duganella sp. sic0402 TaxID=2854786 RepID=UPI001C466BE5|nr:polysaccharide pyruvyl transferase family protein [Duganella sp. sic0402]MBV7535970.1 polysaccharide pyruvyl transferase family protein [Duganella sp. sic0402]
MNAVIDTLNPRAGKTASAPEKMITVGLLWHSLSSGNLGVGALTESNIAIVRGVAESLGQRVRFIVLGSGSESLPSLAAELEQAGHALENQRVRLFRSSFREQVRRCDLVIDIGEGDSFADIYGFKRFFFYWLSKNIVCSLGKPLILAPQTIGPFDGAAARVLAKQVMARCAKVFARDNLSSDYLKQLGVTKNTGEAIDVAFRLPFKAKQFADNGKVRVGINVSGLLFNGGYTGGNQFGLSIDYPSTIRRLIKHFQALPEVEVHLVGHVIEPHMPSEDDYTRGIALAEEFPGVIVAPVFSRPSEAKSYIAGLDYFTGARMHACIAAFSSSVPVVPMAYSRKFNGLFGTLGYNSIADCKADSDDVVVQKISDGYVKRDALKQQVQAGLQRVEERLARYEGNVAQVFNQVIGK